MIHPLTRKPYLNDSTQLESFDISEIYPDFNKPVEDDSKPPEPPVEDDADCHQQSEGDTKTCEQQGDDDSNANELRIPMVEPCEEYAPPEGQYVVGIEPLKPAYEPEIATQSGLASFVQSPVYKTLVGYIFIVMIILLLLMMWRHSVASMTSSRILQHIKHN